MAAMSEQTEAPIVEKQASDNRLAQVVCKAHLSVRSDLYKPVLGTGLIVKKCHSGYDQKHHREVLPHVQHNVQSVVYASVGFDCFWYQIIGRNKDYEAYQGTNKNVLPSDKIVSFIVEQSFTSEKDSEEEKAHSLGHTAVFDGPKEVYRQSVLESGECYIQYRARSGSLIKASPMLSAT